MDIHKPKAWHGAREFGKELGVIVLGVLIALGAEQAVEWLHRQNEVRETREALKDEISLDRRNIEYAQVEDGCADGHLAVWMAWARGAPKPRFTNGIFPPLSFSAWDVAKSGALAHMPLRERLAYTRFYNDLAALQRVKDLETETMTSFTGYRAFERLSPVQADQVVTTITAARALLTYKQRDAVGLVAEAKALGAPPAALDAGMQANLVALCREVGIDVPPTAPAR
jgi:hypothetical protein